MKMMSGGKCKENGNNNNNKKQPIIWPLNHERVKYYKKNGQLYQLTNQPFCQPAKGKCTKLPHTASWLTQQPTNCTLDIFCMCSIKPRKGQYAVFGSAAGTLINSSILPVPTEKGKGMIVFKTGVYARWVLRPLLYMKPIVGKQSLPFHCFEKGLLVKNINQSKTMRIETVMHGTQNENENRKYRHNRFFSRFMI